MLGFIVAFSPPSISLIPPSPQPSAHTVPKILLSIFLQVCSIILPVFSHSLGPLLVLFVVSYPHSCHMRTYFQTYNFGSRYGRACAICLFESALLYLMWYFAEISISIKLSFFLHIWIKFHCAYIPHFHYLFFSHRTSRLTSFLCYGEQCNCKYCCANISVIRGRVLWIIAKEWYNWGKLWFHC